MGRRKVLGEDPYTLVLKVPQVVGDALTLAAESEFMTNAEYVRRTVIERLREEGRLDAPQVRGDVD